MSPETISFHPNPNNSLKDFHENRHLGSHRLNTHRNTVLRSCLLIC